MTQKASTVRAKAAPLAPVATLSKLYFHGLYEEDQKTMLHSFQLVPINSNCPFSRALYDPSNKTMTISGTVTQEYLESVRKLDSFGQPVRSKSQGVYREVQERIRVNRVMETLLSTKEDIMDFVEKTTGSFIFPDGTDLYAQLDKLDKYTHVENPK